MEEGALQGVLGIHGIHVWPGLPAGTVASRVGLPRAAPAWSLRCACPGRETKVLTTAGLCLVGS